MVYYNDPTVFLNKKGKFGSTRVSDAYHNDHGLNMDRDKHHKRLVNRETTDESS